MRRRIMASEELPLCLDALPFLRLVAIVSWSAYSCRSWPHPVLLVGTACCGHSLGRSAWMVFHAENDKPFRR
jgi:hypothetical protein